MLLLLLFILSLIEAIEEAVLRPNLYFGTRSRTEQSHLSGILWFEGSRLDSVRHDCKHEDDIKRWGWTEFDPNGYGKQKLVDIHNFVDLEMKYMKKDNDWVLNIEGRALKNQSSPRNISMIFYYGVNGKDHYLNVPNLSKNEKRRGTHEPIFIPFYSEDVGYGHIRIEEGPNVRSPSNLNTPFSEIHFKPYKEESNLDHAFWFGKKIDNAEDGWTFASMIKEQLNAGYHQFASRLRESAYAYLRKHAQKDLPEAFQQQYRLPFQPLLPNEIETHSNFIAVQRVYTLPFSLTLYVTQDTVQNGLLSKKQVYQQSSFEQVETLDDLFQQRSLEYDVQFASRFDLSKYSTRYQKAAKAAISNLLGGISYFTGDTQQVVNGQHIKTKKGTLITAVPGRSFFPRGFVWDEGFHQLVISEWNITLSEEILRSWFQRIEPSGYLEREQILGDEARSRVPNEFIPQNPKVVNPPTFILVFEKIAQKILMEKSMEVTEDGETTSVPSDEVLFLEESIPKLWKWLQYIQSSQKSELENGLKWFGRSEQHCFASGLDDTPRHSIVSEMESHVDLVAWMTYAYKALSSIEKQLHGETDFYHELVTKYKNMQSELMTKYWDETTHCFGDLGLIDETTVGFETHPSYISVLPFALMLMDEEDPRITDILDLLEDPNRLWSEYGIRSLAKNDIFFGTEEDYWRGKVWINMNYLILRSLHTKYSQVGFAKERCQELYSKLRTNIINTIVKEYYSSGFFWENYNSDTGKGKGVHPFTGWTTLFVLIMAERYSCVCLCKQKTKR